MHHEEIELNFEASCQQILGLESEILWESRSTPTFKYLLHLPNDTLLIAFENSVFAHPKTERYYIISKQNLLKQ
jgi:hypothetical protein